MPLYRTSPDWRPQPGMPIVALCVRSSATTGGLMTASRSCDPHFGECELDQASAWTKKGDPAANEGSSAFAGRPIGASAERDLQEGFSRGGTKSKCAVSRKIIVPAALGYTEKPERAAG